MSTSIQTINIDQDWIPMTISAHRSLLAPSHKPPQDDTVNLKYNQPFSDNSFSNDGKLNNQPGKQKNDGTQTQVYTVHHVFRYVITVHQMKYVESWYGYKSHEDTMEPPKNNP